MEENKECIGPNFIEERARENKKMHLSVFGEPFKAAKE